MTDADGSITRELRELLDGCTTFYYDGTPHGYMVGKGTMDRMLDRIDHACMEKAEQRWRDGYDDGYASADDCWASQDDETLAEHGMVRLPVDADGKTWHVGDVYTLKRDQSHEVCNVSWMTWDGDRWEVDGEAVKQLVRYRFTPAERIRKILDNLDYDNTVKEQPEPLLTIQERDELYSIANELEGARQ